MLIVKKTNLALDMKISPKRLNRLIDNPGLFTMEDSHKIAALIGVPAKSILELISAEYMAKSKKKK